MSERGYQIINQNGIHFITFSTIQWIDVFTRKENCNRKLKILSAEKRAKGTRLGTNE